MANKYICDICSQIFKTKQNLEKHHNKKFKCNIISDFQCEDCKKYFTNKKNYNYHINQQSCKKKNDINLDTTDFIESILNANISNDTKKNLLKIKGILLNDNEINEILNSNNNNNIKKELIKCGFENNANVNTINNSTVSTNSNNNNSNNTVTNNIQINNFGQENLSYMDSEYFKNLIMNQHIEKGYVQLIKDIYLNKDHPENSTVKVENLNNKYAHIYKNGKWDAILKADLKELLHKKNYTILKMHYDKLKNIMTLPKKEETRVFLQRDDFSDPHMMYVIDKIILLFYNDGEGADFESGKINKNVV
jgi:hypothetical protein